MSECLEIAPAPKPGEVRMWKGQRYEFRRPTTYTTKDGRTLGMFAWATHCAECGEAIEVRAFERVPFYPPRRCTAHAAPGKQP